MIPEFVVTLFEEKPIPKGKFSVASWSPKMDIVAVGSTNGTVSLHRYESILTGFNLIIKACFELSTK